MDSRSATTPNLWQTKIDEARSRLSEETLRAIDSVPWKMAILALRAEHGYSFGQLKELEIETELLLCGLLDPEDYPKEISNRMGITRAEADTLVEKMNERVFKRIREELIKILDRKERNSGVKEEKKADNAEEVKENLEPTEDASLVNGTENHLETREEMLKKIEKPETIHPKKEEPHPILAQKLGGAMRAPVVETDHSLPRVGGKTEAEKVEPPRVDPYREIPG